MQTFRYEAQTAEGQALRGTLEASTAAQASSQLQAMQLRVLVVEPAPAERPARRSALGPDDFLIFNQQLAHLTAAGLPVERGLRLIAADLKTGRLSSAANDVAAELERGTPLPDAFARHASRFPRLYARLIDAGVQAGNLPGMLFNLGEHLALITRLRQALWRTLSYPAMVLAAMSLVLLFISVAVVPQFVDIYGDFRTTLPEFTRLVFGVAAIYPMLLLIVACLVAAALLVGVTMRATGRSALLSEAFLWMPLLGPVLRAGLLARWIDALRLSVEAGLDLPRAVELASDATGSKRLEREGKAMVQLLVSGVPAEQFHGRLIPQTVPTSIELASRAGAGGDLQATLATLTRMYREQAEQRLRVVPVLLTPVALLVIACVVMITVVAMFLPLIKLIQSVSGGGEG